MCIVLFIPTGVVIVNITHAKIEILNVEMNIRLPRDLPIKFVTLNEKKKQNYCFKLTPTGVIKIHINTIIENHQT